MEQKRDDFRAFFIEAALIESISLIEFAICVLSISLYYYQSMVTPINFILFIEKCEKNASQPNRMRCVFFCCDKIDTSSLRCNSSTRLLNSLSWCVGGLEVIECEAEFHIFDHHHQFYNNKMYGVLWGWRRPHE